MAFEPRVVGVKRTLLAVSGADDPDERRQVVLQSGGHYTVDEIGNVRDKEGRFCCRLDIWRLLPVQYQQEESFDALAVIEELSNRVPQDDSNYPGWLRAKVSEISERLRSTIGSYKP